MFHLHYCAANLIISSSIFQNISMLPDGDIGVAMDTQVWLCVYNYNVWLHTLFAVAAEQVISSITTSSLWDLCVYLLDLSYDE